ncbi:PH domain-containing protein [Marinobacter sp. VGCF2001]|uniref:PH domain-containing protein n=1 Tax=Marinobacter sp. VGCF2001 TaxID=3417189 RepID=UPI003CF54143
MVKNRDQSVADLKNIALEMGDDQFFTKKEFFLLPGLLQSGEVVFALASGMVGGATWLISLTNLRVLIINKGLVFGLRQDSIPIDQVSSITSSSGLLLAKIIVTASAKRIIVENVEKRSAKEFVRRFEVVLNGGRGQVSERESNLTDKYSELSKLGSLLERGLVTEEEFDIEKKKILGYLD